ncbi:MAG: flippase [Bacillota bacterium]
MALRRKIFRNTIIQVVGKLASTGLNLFAFALMTRELGQAGFGEYTTAITFLSFFAIIADLGLTLVTSQMISSQPEQEEKILGNLFGLRLATALLFIGSAPLAVLLFNYSGDIKLGVLLAAGSFIFTALNQIMVGLFQNRLRMDKVAWAETLSRFVLIIGVILSVEEGWGLPGILISTTAASFASFLLHLYYARRFARIRPTFDFNWWKKIMGLSWPLAVTIAFNLIYLRADTLVLSMVRSQEEVGLYGASYKIIDVLSSLPFMFAGIILPLLSAAWEKADKGRFASILQRSFDAMALIALPIAVGTQFAAKEIIVLVAGPQFLAAGSILRILIMAVAAIFLGNMAAHAIIAVKAQKKIIWIYVFTGLTSLAAYILLIPRFSYFGAAAVTVYSETAIALLSSIFLYRHLKLKMKWTGFLKAAGATGIMAAALYLIPISASSDLLRLLLTLIIGGLTYLLSLYLLKAFTRNDFLSLFKRT